MRGDLDQSLFNAQNLITRGNLKEAVTLLEKLAAQYPQNAKIWWLLSQSYTDPIKIRRALSKTIRCDPNHEQAKILLRKNVQSDTPRLQKPEQNSNAMIFLLPLGFSIFVVFAIIFALSNREDAPDVLPTLFSTVNAVVLPTFTQSAPAVSTPTPTVTSPITVTATSTDAVIVTNPFTVSIIATPQDYVPAVRFHEFPVTIYLATQDQIWVDATQHAVSQISQVVEIVIVYDINAANITIEIVNQGQNNALAGCSGLVETVGCGRIVAVRNTASGAEEAFSYYGNVWVLSSTSNPRGSLLHELLHALGVSEHSPNPEDIMYGYENDTIYMSEYDFNLLRVLYSTP